MTPPDASSSTSSPPARSRFALGAVALLGVLVTLAFLNPPVQVASDVLDASWCQVYGYFLTHRMRAGTDYIFTFGPLGYLYSDVYDGRLFWLKYVWEIATRAYVVTEAGRLALLRGNGRPTRALFLFLAWAALSPLLMPDVFGYLSFVVLGMVLLLDRQVSVARLWGIALFCVAQSLVKHTLVPAALLVVAMGEWNRLARLTPLHVYASPLLASALCFVLLWFGSGQGVANLPAFLGGALQVTAGYGDAMGSHLIGLRALLLAFPVLAALVVAVAAIPALRPRPLPVAGYATLLALFIAVNWKHAFTRMDEGHTPIFFVSSLYLLSFLAALFAGDGTSPLPRAGRRRDIALSIAGTVTVAATVFLFARTPLLRPQQRFASFLPHLSTAARFAITPWQEQARLEGIRRDAAARFDLPGVRTLVGDAPVDVWGFEQGVALLNGLHYRPRPVFHSYQACTPSLRERNAAFFRGPDAPAFVLFKLQTIDSHFATADDALALREILLRYTPALREKGYLLLRRGASGTAAAGDIWVKATAPPQVLSAQLGQDVALAAAASNTLQTIRITARPTVAGKALGLLTSPMPVLVQVTFDNGETALRQVMTGHDSETFLLDPFLDDNADTERAFWGAPGAIRRVRSLRVMASPHFWRSPVELTVETYQLPTHGTASPGMG